MQSESHHSMGEAPCSGRPAAATAGRQPSGASAGRLLLRIGESGLDIVAWPSVGGMEYSSVRLPGEPSGPFMSQQRLMALEGAIYDTPRAVEGCGDAAVKVTVLVDDPRALALSRSVEPAEARQLLERAWPGEGGEAMVDAVGRHGCVAWLCEPSLVGFLRRTFMQDVDIRHPLGALGHWALLHASGAGTRTGCTAIYGHLGHDGLDVCAVGEGRLLLAASHRASLTPEDAAYYMLASMRAVGADTDTSVMRVCGNGEQRAGLSRELGRFVEAVEPVIFPSEAFRAGRAAMKAPFDLIIS